MIVPANEVGGQDLTAPRDVDEAGEVVEEAGTPVRRPLPPEGRLQRPEIAAADLVGPWVDGHGQPDAMLGEEVGEQVHVAAGAREPLPAELLVEAGGRPSGPARPGLRSL